jgi:flagellar M-ring protein FliF
VSETQREILRIPGAVKRISVAVLVNDVSTQNDAGESSVTPRPDEELEDLRVLVASAVGFDADRGDEITIRSMPFVALPLAGTDAGGGAVPATPLDIMQLVQTGVLALVALVLGLFVVRPILTSNRPTPALLDSSGGGVAGALTGPNGTIIDGIANAPSNQTTSTDAPVTSLEPSDDPVERLRGLIEDRRDEAIQVLQSWIDEPDKEAGN